MRRGEYVSSSERVTQFSLTVRKHCLLGEAASPAYILQKKFFQPDDCFDGTRTAPVGRRRSGEPVPCSKKSHQNRSGLSGFELPVYMGPRGGAGGRVVGGADTFKAAVWTLGRAVLPSVDGDRHFKHTLRNVVSPSPETA